MPRRFEDDLRVKLTITVRRNSRAPRIWDRAKGKRRMPMREGAVQGIFEYLWFCDSPTPSERQEKARLEGLLAGGAVSDLRVGQRHLGVSRSWRFRGTSKKNTPKPGALQGMGLNAVGHPGIAKTLVTQGFLDAFGAVRLEKWCR